MSVCTGVSDPSRSAIVVVVPGSMDPEAIADLCERVRALVESRATRPVVCDVSALTEPDARALDAIARLQLIARRAGIPVGLYDPPAILVDLLALTGLSDAIPTGSVVERDRQVEQRKQAGIDEEVHPRDAIA